MPEPIIVCDGDSITNGFGASTSYPLEITPNAGPWNILNKAVDGNTLATCFSTAPSNVDTAYNVHARPICIIWAGTNDFGAGSTVAAVYTILTNYVAARHSVGWAVIVCTMLSRTGTNPVGMESLDADKNAYNALILANTAGADAIASFVGTPLGIDGGYSNLTWFQSDGTHPTQAAIDTYEAPIIQAAINTYTAIGSGASQLPPPAPIQFNSDETASPTLVVPYNKAVSAGSLLCATLWAATGAGTGIDDSLNGAWTTLIKQTDGGVDVLFGYLLNSKAGANTVTFTTTTNTIFGSIIEFSGVSAFDTFAQSLLTSMTPTENIITAGKGELLVGWLGSESGPASVDPGTNMTALYPNELNPLQCIGYGIISAAGATSLGFILDSSRTVMMGVAAFAPAKPRSGARVISIN